MISKRALTLALPTTIATTKILAVAKPGDKCWTAVNQHLSFAGRFYGVTRGAIVVVEAREDQPSQLGGGLQAAELTLLDGRLSMMVDTAHLVDNNGELLLVHRALHRSDGCPSGYKRVYRVDLDARKTVPVRGLGGRAAFIGHYCSLSVSPATCPSIIADAVYPCISFGDETAYHLADGTIEHSNYANSYSDLAHIVDHPFLCATRESGANSVAAAQTTPVTSGAFYDYTKSSFSVNN